jgi:hypothetical protein
MEGPRLRKINPPRIERIERIDVWMDITCTCVHTYTFMLPLILLIQKPYGKMLHML